MNDIVLNLILFCVVLLLCGLSAVGGFFIGKYAPDKRLERSFEPVSEEERRKIEKRRREDMNFLNYDGTVQQDVI